MIVDVEPGPKTRAGLGPGLPGVQVDAIIPQRSPEPFDEDAVEEASLAVHRICGRPRAATGRCRQRL